MSNSSKSSSIIWNVVISGASKGIGREIAFTFAKAGHQLLLTARNEEKLKATAEAIRSKFPASKIHFKAADLSKKDEAISFGR